MTPVTICLANTGDVRPSGGVLSPRLAARLGEGTHSEVQKSQRECGRKEHLSDSRGAMGVTMVFAHGSRAADQRKHQEK